MVDLSIKSILKMTDSEFNEFKKHNWKCFEKFDGTKLSLIRNSESFNKDDYTKNWIVAYKGNIIYPFEFKTVDEKSISYDSIGCSQYKLFFNELKSQHEFLKDFPVNTEFFLEFIMKKPTLTREYDYYHHAVLLGYSKIKSMKVQHSKIETENDKFETELNEYFSRIWCFKTPNELFYFPSFNSKDELISFLKEKLKTTISLFGKKIEGIVLRNENNEYWKIVQEDQYDKETRSKIKDKWRMDYEKERIYYKLIFEKSLELLEQVKTLNFQKALEELSEIVYGNYVCLNYIHHEKKNDFQKRDDLYLTCKTNLIRRLMGNNWCLFVGKFRIFTIKHYQIIKDVLSEYDGVVICIVSSKDQKISSDFRENVIKTSFQKEFEKGKIEFVHSRNGNLINIINKAKHNINAVVCGSDRRNDYEEQLKDNFNIKVQEIYRLDNISATRLSEFVKGDLKCFFEKYTPKSVHNFYSEYRKYFNNGEFKETDKTT